MVRRVPTTDVLIKRVIFVGRAVDSHSTGTEIGKLASTFTHFLANELYEASQGLGSALQKRDELHKLAESNRALLTQRWW